MFGFKRRRRERLRRRPFPDEWRRILERSFPYYRRLPERDREELHGHVHVFLAEKYFEGAAGLVVTDEMRVVVAAQACILLLHRDTDYYPGLKTILLYPDAYAAPSRTVGPAGVVTESTTLRLGESWHGLNPGRAGPVVLSWRSVQEGAADPRDGRNVVFHEFAHQLDAEDGSVEGAPALELRSRYAAWARALGAEYNALIEDLARGQRTLLGSYAATSPPEFFAVATELFFERPTHLRARHPALYEQLREFFRQDPASLPGPGEDRGTPAASTGGEGPTA